MDINKEMPIYSGISTFMGANFINEDEIYKYDIVFLGVPIDYGATYRLGSKYAPRKLRELSSWLRIDGEDMYDFDKDEILKTNILKIADIGDIEVDPTNPEHNQTNISEKVYKIRKETFPLVCGGDHSITYGSFIGCYKAMKELEPEYEIGIIHFDAHLDLEDKYLNMPRVWHGNVFRRLIENDYLKGENLYTIGVRALEEYELIKYAKDNRINIYPNKKVKEIGLEKIIDKILEKNKNKKIKYYITFDIDGIDMCSVSGTGTPQSDGLKVTECNYVLRYMKKLDIVGFDIVELNPIIDSSDSTFIIAIELLYNFLGFGYKKGEKNEKNSIIV